VLDSFSFLHLNFVIKEAVSCSSNGVHASVIGCFFYPWFTTIKYKLLKAGFKNAGTVFEWSRRYMAVYINIIIFILCSSVLWPLYHLLLCVFIF
jgi:hypothetical protein